MAGLSRESALRLVQFRGARREAGAQRTLGDLGDAQDAGGRAALDDDGHDLPTTRSICRQALFLVHTRRHADPPSFIRLIRRHG